MIRKLEHQPYLSGQIRNSSPLRLSQRHRVSRIGQTRRFRFFDRGLPRSGERLDDKQGARRRMLDGIDPLEDRDYDDNEEGEEEE